MAEARAPRDGVTGLSMLGGLLVCAAALSGYAASTAMEDRRELILPFTVEVFLLFGLAGALVMRDPEGRLRLSNPAVLLIGWMFYYFVKPALAWMQGYRMALESPGTILLDADTVAQVQYAHCLFALALYGAFFLVAPAAVPDADPSGKRDTAIRPVPFLLLGLLPYAMNVVERLVTTGSIVATASYGELTETGVEDLEASRQVGGAGYFVTQVLSKVWYLPVMSLGIGYYALLARFIRERRRTAQALFFAQVPLLLLLGNGGRSYTAFPFLMAFILTDALTKPLRWVRFLPVAAAAIQAFDFYGVFRGFQTAGPTAAFASAMDHYRNEAQMLNTEDGVMLTKEAYCLLLARHGTVAKGLSHFFDTVVLLLPAQIAPGKLSLRSTADFLSDELLGMRRRGSGVAGTMVGDGFLIDGDWGVPLLGAVLGVILGLTVRWGYGDGTRPRLWRSILMLLITAQTTQYIRADLVVVLTQLLYYVLLPTIVIQLLLSAKVLDRATWELPLRTLRSSSSK